PLHTIYLRQHNKWAAQSKRLRPTLSDGTIYQETRRLMIALYQSHVYSEYLPKIIGTRKMNEFNLNRRAIRRTTLVSIPRCQWNSALLPSDLATPK
ncbi:hypothetical protein PENTCL1PPCAC_18680, partial [Pristionchus entomophagus]